MSLKNNVILITIITINIENIKAVITVNEKSKLLNEHFDFANMCS